MEKSLKFFLVFSGSLFVALIATIACTSLNNEKELDAILVNPSNTMIHPDQNQQFSAYGAYSDGSVSNITDEVIWGSSNSDVASMDSVGLARAKSEGTTEITAEMEGVNGTASLVVSATPKAIPSIPDGHATSNCAFCHATGLSGSPKWPSYHVAEWNVVLCKGCHQTSGTKTFPGIPNPHPVKDCASCHSTPITGVPQWPITHAADWKCSDCHSTATSVSSVPDIPASHPNAACDTCHAIGSSGVPRWPVSHTEQWPCDSCHVKATTGVTVPAIPAGHSLVNCSTCHTDRKPSDCYLCHATGAMGAPQWPADHIQNWPCSSCHPQG